ncbi:DUF6898 family protein [Azospirillum sp. sgz301742]
MANMPEDEVLLEYVRLGPYMKVMAIDAKTGVEVSVAGPAVGCRELLTRTAISKLNYVMRKNAGNGR